MRKFLLTLWNTYSFFTLYAGVDGFVPQTASSGNGHPQALREMDHWIISELNRLVVEVTKFMDTYNLTAATRRIQEFVDNLSNWYVRRNRRRFWKSESDADKLAAYSALYRCLVTLCQLLAPFVPFVAEELYQNLCRSVDPQARESVHLSDFPVADKAQMNDGLNTDVELAMKISSLGRAARAKAGIRVRQPLAKAMVAVRTGEEAFVVSNPSERASTPRSILLAARRNFAKISLCNFLTVESLMPLSSPGNHPPTRKPSNRLCAGSTTSS